LQSLFMYGAPGRIRTYDLLIRSQTLYPAELRAHVSCRDLYYQTISGLSTARMVQPILKEE
jgi:hypothetical protein